MVLPDADAATVAAQIAAAAFSFAGQKCAATKRVIVLGRVAEFTDALVAATEKLILGHPADAATIVGPVIEETARARVLHAAEGARAAGARVLTGGFASADVGWFVPPTIVDLLPEGADLLREETFGPICAIVSADSVEDAVRRANDVRYGLTAAVYTGDLNAALRLTDGLAAGQIKVNAATTGVDFYLPFGGERDSSYGPREQGKAAQELYTAEHIVTIAPADRG